MQDNAQVIDAVETYGDMVRRICFLYLKNSSDAEDAFQEVFLRLLLHSGSFQSEEHRKAWLARVAIHRCQDLFKRMFRQRSAPLEDAELVSEEPPHVYRDVYDAVLALPQRYKSVVYLHYFEGYSAVEVARILGKNENTVYTWLSRARQLLRDRLGGELLG